MFGLKKKGGPTRPFSHATDCKLVKIDPDIAIEWQEIETGHWVAECQCGKEHHHEALADGRVRLDPLDPSTFRHQPACDQRDVTDPAIIKATMRVQDREGYWWVESSMCACCWQTPYLAAEQLMPATRNGRLIYRGVSETEARAVLDRTPHAMLVGSVFGR